METFVKGLVSSVDGWTRVYHHDFPPKQEVSGQMRANLLYNINWFVPTMVETLTNQLLRRKNAFRILSYSQKICLQGAL